jgi:hypothetical protein
VAIAAASEDRELRNNEKAPDCPQPTSFHQGILLTAKIHPIDIARTVSFRCSVADAISNLAGRFQVTQNRAQSRRK